MSELSFFFLIVRAQPRSTRTDTLFPYPTRVRSVGGEAIVQKGAERVDPVGGDGQPCRHRMAAARDEQPRLLRGEDRGAEVDAADRAPRSLADRSEEHTSELQSLMRISYAVFCLKKKKYHQTAYPHNYAFRN